MDRNGCPGERDCCGVLSWPRFRDVRGCKTMRDRHTARATYIIDAICLLVEAQKEVRQGVAAVGSWESPREQAIRLLADALRSAGCVEVEAD